MSCDECEKNSITNHILCMDCYEKEMIGAENNGAIQELNLLKKELKKHNPLFTKISLPEYIENRLKELLK